MKSILSLFNIKLPLYYTYMLQQVEYEPAKFIEWLFRLFYENKSIKTVMNRKSLVPTTKARALIIWSYSFSVILVFTYVYFLKDLIYWPVSLFAIILATPLYLVLFLWLTTLIAHYLIILPKQKKLIEQAKLIFEQHSAKKIAVLGSYGKTTVKEILATVLAEGMKVAVTPGNKNVSVSHAEFARKLSGEEEVLIVEFGEGEPGDIKRMSEMLKPDIAVITGLAPNHLDHYESLEAVANDFNDIYQFIEADNVYVNGDSKLLSDYIQKGSMIYSHNGVSDWKVGQINVEINKISFKIKSKKDTLLESKLLGRHQIGALTLAFEVAKELGMTDEQIKAGISKTTPYNHRMQPRNLNGAWIIDDTYNGNLEGLMAGLDYLKEIKAKRKWYVTPGLVDQGVETENVHKELGKKIAQTQPDIVVLMQNSVTQIIKSSMEKHGFKGELRIEENPLEFYLNIEHMLANGDVVLMQNDWTDNYN